MKGWLRLDLVRLLVLAIPVIVAHAALVAWVPPATRPAWMLALAVILAVACLLLLGVADRSGPRTLGRARMAFFLAFVVLVGLAADMDLLSGERVPLEGFDEELPPNVFGLGWLEDWHYRVAPPASQAGNLLVVSLPSFAGMTREEVRQRLAFLVREASRHGARGVAFDVYFEQPSQIDFLLRREVEAARRAGVPVVFGYRQIEKEGHLVRQVLPPELEAVAEHRGHLQGYLEGDGQVRLIPTVLPRVGEWPALSVTVAKLLAGREPDVPSKRLLRFVKPPGPRQAGGVDVLPFARDLDRSVFRDRFVFVGSGSESDRVRTPYGAVQGVEIHAWAAHSLATGSALVDVDPRYTVPLIFAVAYVLVVLHARGERRRRIALAALALSAAVVAGALVVLRVGRLWLEVGYPLTAVWLLTGLLLAGDLYRARADRRAAALPPPAAVPAPAAGGGQSPESFDVFLSHNGHDKPAVRELCAALRERGLVPWLDEEQLVPGRRWQEALEEVLATIPAVAILVGADGLGPWEEAEMRGALSESVRRGLPVIPVLLPGAPRQPVLPLFLTQYTWVDLRGGFTGAGLDRLEWGVTGRKPALRAA